MLTDLRLQHFRSYKDSSFEVGPGVNIVVGPNASGKTNLLEAVLVLARGSSYRASDQELIQHKYPWARLDGHTQKNLTRTVKIVGEDGGRVSKTYEIEGRNFKRLTLEHSLPVVLFEPNHLQLFVGGPEGRRDYLDDLLEQTTTGYTALRRQYRRALAQRNNLLKQPGANDTQIFPWNIRLSQLAGQIVRARSELAEKINGQLPKLYKELSKSRAKAAAEYACRWAPAAYESHLLKKLESSLAEDRARGFTSHGPHREDLDVYLNGHLLQSAASRGETRTVVLALKIIELRLLEEARGSTPLLLLDDVFSELDGRRRHALTDYLTPYQTFITTTDADAVVEHFAGKTNIIALS